MMTATNKFNIYNRELTIVTGWTYTYCKTLALNHRTSSRMNFQWYVENILHSLIIYKFTYKKRTKKHEGNKVDIGDGRTPAGLWWFKVRLWVTSLSRQTCYHYSLPILSCGTSVWWRYNHWLPYLKQRKKRFFHNSVFNRKIYDLNLKFLNIIKM